MDYNFAMVERRGLLQKRIAFAIIFGMLTILFSFGIVSYYIVSKNIETLMNDRLILARSIRQNIDEIIKDNVNRLYDISLSGNIDFRDGNPGPEREALRRAYRYSIFSGGVFLLDRGGNVIMNYPERIMDTEINLLSVEPVNRVLASGKPVISNVYTSEPTGKKNAVHSCAAQGQARQLCRGGRRGN